MVDGSGWDDRFNDDEGFNFFKLTYLFFENRIFYSVQISNVFFLKL